MQMTVKNSSGVGLKTVAVLLIFGGVTGFIPAFRQSYRHMHGEEISQLGIPILSMILFGWSAWVGFRLWRGAPSSIRQAFVLFALQVLELGILGCAYEFSTGLSLRVMVGGHAVDAAQAGPSHYLLFGGNLGSSLNLKTSGGEAGWMIGINLVALGVCGYLVKRLRTRNVAASDAIDSSSTVAQA